jgi:hypothetical protein
MDPKHPWWRAWYAWMRAYEGEVSEAERILRESKLATPDDMHTKLALMQIYGLKGDQDGAERELTSDFREWCWRERAWSACLATAFALLGEKDQALDWLEHSVDSGYVNYPLFSEGDPWLENIRGEDRFKELMSRVKHEWETFEI